MTEHQHDFAHFVGTFIGNGTNGMMSACDCGARRHSGVVFPPGHPDEGLFLIYEPDGTVWKARYGQRFGEYEKCGQVEG